MSEATSIKKHLEKVGLSKNQAEIYTLLLCRGGLRISDIVRNLELPRSSVYENIKGLFNLGLAEEIVENSFKVIRAYPIGSIKHSLDEKIQQLKRQSGDIDYLEKALDVLPSLSAQPPITVRYYKDFAGARQLFWNSLKTKSTVYVQSGWGRSRYVGTEFYKRFVAESYARNIKEQVLTNSTPRILRSIREHLGSPLSRSKYDDIRCLNDSSIIFKGDTLIYDNIYAHVDLKNEQISGFEIESQQFSETQRAIFETLWTTAKPLTSNDF